MKKEIDKLRDNYIKAEREPDLICAFNELNEVLNDFDDLSLEEFIECLPTIKKRISDAQFHVGKYLNDNDVVDY